MALELSRVSGSLPVLPMLTFRLMIILVFSFSIAFYWILQEVFLSDAQEFLMTLPLSTPVILTSKAIEALIISSFWSIFLFPYLLATYGVKAFSLSSILNCFGLLVAVHLYALAISTLVIGYFWRLFSSLTPKILETLRRFVSFIGGVAAVGSFMGETWYGRVFIPFYRFIERHYYIFPTHWMAKLVVAPGTSSWMQGFESIAVLVLPLLFLFLILYMLSPGYAMHLPPRRTCSIQPNRCYNLDYNRFLGWLPLVNRGLIVKDLRLMLREQGVLSTASVFIVLSSIMQLITVKLGQRNLLNIQRWMIISTATALPILFSLITTLRIFGMERNFAGYITKVVSGKNLFWTKFMVGFSLTLMGSYLSLTVAKLTALTIGWEFPYFATRVVLVFLSSFLFSSLALGTAFLYPNFKSGGVLLVGILRWYLLLSIHFVLYVLGISVLWSVKLTGLKVVSGFVIIGLLMWSYRRAIRAVHLAVSAEY